MSAHALIKKITEDEDYDVISPPHPHRNGLRVQVRDKVSRETYMLDVYRTN